MNSDSRWLSNSWDLFTDPAIQNAYHTTDVFSTTWWRQTGIWQTQLGTNSDLGLSLDTDTCIVHKQTNKDCALRATINSDRSATSSVWHKQEEKQPRRRDASATRKNNLVNVGKYTNLITLLDLCVSSQHSPNTVTRRSHNSIGHGVVGVNMVGKGCSSQQKQMKRRKSALSVMKHVFWRTSEAKKSGKKKNQLENNQRVKERNVKTAIFLTWEFSFQTTKKKEICNGCLAAEINDNRMHMDLTRSTTSRHAAIVKRTFERARDPQRMWISRDYHKMRYGQKHFCYKSNFCGKRCSSKQEKRKKGIF